MTAAVEAPSTAPRSWAEDLQTYRDTRGSRAWAKASDKPKSYGRTCLVPFSDTKHSLYAYNDFPQYDGGTRTQQDPTIQNDRYFRHGWGDTTLLKEEGFAGTLHPRGQCNTPQGKARPVSPRAADGRHGLFGVLQQTEAGGLDSWIGHPQVDPSKGKRPVAPPSDTRGRRDLFDVLHARNPGIPADDAWLGNKLINPAKGKASVPGPEQRRGRRDLSDTFTQSILREPNRAELLEKGKDPLADAWCGHMLIDPSKGKAPTHCQASESALIGAAFKPPVPTDYTDFKRRHTRAVEPPVADMARDVVNGTASLDVGAMKRGKKEVSECLGKRIDDRRDLYANMTYRPLSDKEQRVFSRALDDGHITGKAHIDMPGSNVFGKGPDMLAWRPEQAVGQFVPYGKLAQEGRAPVKPGVQGGTMQRPMTIPRTLSLNSAKRF